MWEPGGFCWDLSPPLVLDRVIAWETEQWVSSCEHTLSVGLQGLVPCLLLRQYAESRNWWCASFHPDPLPYTAQMKSSPSLMDSRNLIHSSGPRQSLPRKGKACTRVQNEVERCRREKQEYSAWEQIGDRVIEKQEKWKNWIGGRLLNCNGT